MRRLPSLPLTLTLTALLLAACPAAGQTLPAGIESRTTLGPADAQAVEAFVRELLPAMEQAPLEVERARRAITTPLLAPGVSVAFRQQLASGLGPALERLAKHERDHVAANAMLVAGRIASTNTLGALRAGLADQRPGVRYAAAKGVETVFDAVAGSAPAVDSGQLAILTRDVAKLVETDADALVADGASLALLAAARMQTRQGFDALSSQAATALAAAATKRAQAIAPGSAADGLRVLARAVVGLSQIARDVAARLEGVALSDDAKRQIGGLAGDALAAAVRLADDPAADKDALRQIVAASESMAVFAAQSLRSDPNTALRAAAELDAGRRERFVAEVQKVIGPDGFLTKPPFAFPADRFRTR